MCHYVCARPSVYVCVRVACVCAIVCVRIQTDRRIDCFAKVEI